MEKLLKWIADTFGVNPQGLILALIVGALMWLTPKLFERADKGTDGQITILTNDLINCRANWQAGYLKADSLQAVINKMTADRLKESLEREKAERERRKKYEDAMMTVNQTKKTIDNLNKKVQNEIQ